MSRCRVVSQPKSRVTRFPPSVSRGGSGVKNGVLLRTAAAGGVEVLLTADRSLEFQQNLERIGIAVIVVGGRNRLQDLKRPLPAVVSSLETIQAGEAVRISGR